MPSRPAFALLLALSVPAVFPVYAAAPPVAHTLRAEQRPESHSGQPAVKIDGAAMLRHVQALASDEFEGRAPGSRGETVTVNYLQEVFKKAGIAPAMPDGGYLQNVPMMYMQSTPALSYAAVGGKSVALAYPEDFIAWSMRAERKVSVANSELVFVGYGVTAPEFQWDDYKGADLKGKTLVMLINDPPLPDPKKKNKLDDAIFGGAAMTYYGRWTYKFAMAAKLGAAGALIVHETKAAGYPYDVVRNSFGRGNYGIKVKGDTPGLPPVPGWLSLARARDMFKAGGHDFDTLKKAALSRDFKPVPLGVTVNMAVANAWGDMASHNVVGKIDGADPKLKDEAVVYTAHWDHFGIDDTLPGPRSKQIFHGALDNATGVAALLEIARTYKALPPAQAPKRTVLFVLTTGEERGLLGAQFYTRHPVLPLAKTVVTINLDGMNVWGKTRDVILSGHGKSAADELVMAAAKAQGRVVKPEVHAESGMFYRGDQFEFARSGVPVIFTQGGVDYVGKAPNQAAKLAQYTARDYHTVNDTVQPDWDMAGAAQDAELLFQAGYRAAQDAAGPQWKAWAEFKSVRETAK
ncbi:M28 family peptidase [Pseudoduganella ginsengisoli]|uniref:M28 family peptidase n=1 Tax=Pseudoduganella ginsengisoli TaxID=1462440 RepID=A0A6L6PZI9_9BURK|nr:M28 family peptidase [Pseudoduganella ginsengisoli]MTW02666.1 M28 family peptidase [Pseudoduganella ginsengisoli]